MKNARIDAGRLLLATLIAATPLHAQDHGDHSHGPGEEHDHAGAPPPPNPELPPGMVAIPRAVRDNLGITFAKVERRVVQGTLRLPGRFEATPQSTSEYRAGARGLVTLAARQYDRVAEGDLLFRIESEAWRDVQSRLSQAQLAAELIDEQEQAAARAVETARSGVETWRARAATLRELQVQGAAQASQLADANSQLAVAEGALAEALARSQALRIESLGLRRAEGGNPRFEMALREAATLFGADEGWLLEESDGRPRWQTLRGVEVRARRSGVVELLGTTGGGLVESGGLVVRTVEPKEVRFRAFALQADIGLVEDGASVRIVPPHGGIATYTESLEATIMVGIEADPGERTFDLVATPSAADLPAWARPGVAAFLEVVLAGSSDPEFAVPLGAVVNDGLERILFLRDRSNPDRARRVVADIGADDGRWIVVNSGVRPGDEVVVDGVHELKMTVSGSQQQGGHFHSDGTFHVGEE